MLIKLHEEISVGIMIVTDINVMELSQKPTLEDRIRELINKVTDSIYISSLEVIRNDDIYVLKMGLNCKDASPISIGYQGNEEGFMEFLCSEFQKRKLQNIRRNSITLLNGNSNVFYPIIEL